MRIHRQQNLECPSNKSLSSITLQNSKTKGIDTPFYFYTVNLEEKSDLSRKTFLDMLQNLGEGSFNRFNTEVGDNCKSEVFAVPFNVGHKPKVNLFFTTPQNQVSSLADDNIYDEEVQKNLYP
jgi:hypothetical protein